MNAGNKNAMAGWFKSVAVASLTLLAGSALLSSYGMGAGTGPSVKPNNTPRYAGPSPRSAPSGPGGDQMDGLRHASGTASFLVLGPQPRAPREGGRGMASPGTGDQLDELRSFGGFAGGPTVAGWVRVGANEDGSADLRVGFRLKF